MLKVLRAKILMLKWRFMGNRFFFALAKKRAVKKHKKTGKHFTVYFLNGRYRVMTRSDMQRKKHDGSFAWHVNATNMKRFSFYSTYTEPCTF